MRELFIKSNVIDYMKNVWAYPAWYYMIYGVSGEIFLLKLLAVEKYFPKFTDIISRLDCEAPRKSAILLFS